VLELKLVYNDGVAFGMLQGSGLVLTPLAAAIAAGAAASVWRAKDPGPIHTWVCAMLAAGALGNMVDRLRFGRVTDMFYVRAIDFPVFNVADVCISLAAVALVLGTFVRRKAGPEASATSGSPPT
jgi:signal peptidase II